jgi:hypothetical protein
MKFHENDCFVVGLDIACITFSIAGEGETRELCIRECLGVPRSGTQAMHQLHV